MEETDTYCVNVNLFIQARSKEEAIHFANEMLDGREIMTKYRHIVRATI